jgi:hypothetical protein
MENQMMEGNRQNCRPFLPMLAVPRTGSAGILPGRYSTEHDMWMVDGENGPLPIISAPQEYLVAPVTKIKGERDEAGRELLELSTKTEKQVER